jgi:hypothetical protein
LKPLVYQSRISCEHFPIDEKWQIWKDAGDYCSYEDLRIIRNSEGRIEWTVYVYLRKSDVQQTKAVSPFKVGAVPLEMKDQAAICLKYNTMTQKATKHTLAHCF